MAAVIFHQAYIHIPSTLLTATELGIAIDKLKFQRYGRASGPF